MRQRCRAGPGTGPTRSRGRHLAEVRQPAVGAARKVMRIKRKPQHPTRVGQGAQHRVRLVASRRMPPVGIGMGDGDGAGRMVDRLQRGSFGGMAHVHHQPDAIHLLHHGAAHAGEARVLVLVAAGRQQRLIVVAQLHEPHAQLVHDFDKADVVLDRAGGLEPEEHRRAPRLLCAADVGGGGALEDQAGKAFEPEVPGFQVGDHLAKILVVGDGDMHRVDTAAAQLAEHLFRPVGILQVVDQGRLHVPTLAEPCRSSKS